MVRHDGTAVAWVESPFQLIGALEAHAGGMLADRLYVVPRAGLESLDSTVAEFRRLGLPERVTVLPPAQRPPAASLLAIGDAFSGQVQRLLAARSAGRTVLLDDGRATRRMLDALLCRGVPLLRPHVPAPVTRRLLARVALSRLRGAAASGRLEVVTALKVPASTVLAARVAGLPVHRHDFGWLRSLPLPAHEAATAAGQRTVVLGSSMVAGNLIDAEAYLGWVRSLGPARRLTYWAHRREDARTLAPLAAAGLDVRPGTLPVEVTLRSLPAGRRVVTLPTTAASTLQLLAPQAVVEEYAVPAGWWLPSVPHAARLRLVPEHSAGVAAPGRPSLIGVP